MVSLYTSSTRGPTRWNTGQIRFIGTGQEAMYSEKGYVGCKLCVHIPTPRWLLHVWKETSALNARIAFCQISTSWLWILKLVLGQNLGSIWKDHAVSIWIMMCCSVLLLDYNLISSALAAEHYKYGSFTYKHSVVCTYTTYAEPVSR